MHVKHWDIGVIFIIVTASTFWKTVSLLDVNINYSDT